MKLVILLALAAIVVSLGSALFSLTRSGGTADTGTLRALTWRIGLSLVLFLFILLSIHMGWVAPHGLRG